MNKFILLGVGNRLRGDDGAGSILADRMVSMSNNSWLILDGGLMPENFTSIIKKEKPEKLFIVDACEMGESAGIYKILDTNEISEEYSFNSHSAPLKFFIEYLSPYTKEIIFIGIQPLQIFIGDNLSEIVSNSINELINILIKKEFYKIKKSN